MNNKIFWLASYPKSGNTLLRSILVSLFFTDDGIFSLDKLKNISQFEETSHIIKNKELFGTDFKDIHKIEVLYKYILKLQSSSALNIDDNKLIFLKTHSGLFNVLNYPFTSVSNTSGVIYTVRDPRDVCISWSRHSGKSLEQSIEFMFNNNQGLQWNETNLEYVFNNKNRPMYYLSSWSRHVKSWCYVKWQIPKLIIKFEDFIYNKEQVIIRLINFFEKNYKIKFQNKNLKIKNIIQSTSFNSLKKEESEKGFSEAPKNQKFFSVGKMNQWKNILRNEQIYKIQNNFIDIMEEFNYEINSSYE